MNPNITPLPWKPAFTGIGNKFYIASELNGKEAIAQFYGPNTEANRYFVLKACNSHAQLVEALKEAMELIDNDVVRADYKSRKLLEGIEALLSTLEESK